MINFKIVIRIIGILLLLETVMLLACSGVSFYYQDEALVDFWVSAGITAGAGLLLAAMGKGGDRQLTRRDGYVLVSFAWIAFSLFGMLPFYISGYIPSITNAFFETMSGFSSTGATIMNNIESMPHGILFWRAMTQWIGGLGIVFFTIAVLPIFGMGGIQVFAAEASGPTHDKVHPRIGVTAKWIWGIYAGMTGTLIVLLVFGGMSVFDSICHAFTTTSTGGFSTKQNSIAYWDSAYIQYVIIIFTFMAGTNFGLLHTAIRGNWRKLIQDNEFQLYFTIVLLASVVIGVGLYVIGWADFEKSMRDATFQVVTLITTTGFATADYLLWPPLLGLILFLLLFVGASAGSTAGGMKVVRVYLLFKNSFVELKRIIHPNGIINVKYNNKSVHPNIMTGIMAFAILFMIVFTIGSLIMTIFTEDIITACSAVVSSMSNVGPGFGSVGPMFSYAHLNDFAKLFLAFLMLVGRLEIFTVMVLFTKAFWRK